MSEPKNINPNPIYTFLSNPVVQEIVTNRLKLEYTNSRASEEAVKKENIVVNFEEQVKLYIPDDQNKRGLDTIKQLHQLVLDFYSQDKTQNQEQIARDIQKVIENNQLKQYDIFFGFGKYLIKKNIDANQKVNEIEEDIIAEENIHRHWFHKFLRYLFLFEKRDYVITSGEITGEENVPIIIGPSDLTLSRNETPQQPIRGYSPSPSYTKLDIISFDLAVYVNKIKPRLGSIINKLPKLDYFDTKLLQNKEKNSEYTVGKFWMDLFGIKYEKRYFGEWTVKQVEITLADEEKTALKTEEKIIEVNKFVTNFNLKQYEELDYIKNQLCTIGNYSEVDKDITSLQDLIKSYYDYIEQINNININKTFRTSTGKTSYISNITLEKKTKLSEIIKLAQQIYSRCKPSTNQTQIEPITAPAKEPEQELVHHHIDLTYKPETKDEDKDNNLAYALIALLYPPVVRRYIRKELLQNAVSTAMEKDEQLKGKTGTKYYDDIKIHNPGSLYLQDYFSTPYINLLTRLRILMDLLDGVITKEQVDENKIDDNKWKEYTDCINLDLFKYELDKLMQIDEFKEDKYDKYVNYILKKILGSCSTSLKVLQYLPQQVSATILNIQSSVIDSNVRYRIKNDEIKNIKGETLQLPDNDIIPQERTEGYYIKYNILESEGKQEPLEEKSYVEPNTVWYLSLLNNYIPPKVTTSKSKVGEPPKEPVIEHQSLESQISWKDRKFLPCNYEDGDASRVFKDFKVHYKLFNTGLTDNTELTDITEPQNITEESTKYYYMCIYITFVDFYIKLKNYHQGIGALLINNRNIDENLFSNILKIIKSETKLRYLKKKLIRYKKTLFGPFISKVIKKKNLKVKVQEEQVQEEQVQEEQVQEEGEQEEGEQVEGEKVEGAQVQGQGKVEGAQVQGKVEKSRLDITIKRLYIYIKSLEENIINFLRDGEDIDHDEGNSTKIPKFTIENYMFTNEEHPIRTFNIRYPLENSISICDLNTLKKDINLDILRKITDKLIFTNVSTMIADTLKVIDYKEGETNDKTHTTINGIKSSLEKYRENFNGLPEYNLDLTDLTYIQEFGTFNSIKEFDEYVTRIFKNNPFNKTLIVMYYFTYQYIVRQLVHQMILLCLLLNPENEGKLRNYKDDLQGNKAIIEKDIDDFFANVHEYLNNILLYLAGFNAFYHKAIYMLLRYPMIREYYELKPIIPDLPGNTTTLVSEKLPPAPKEPEPPAPKEPEPPAPQEPEPEPKPVLPNQSIIVKAQNKCNKIMSDDGINIIITIDNQQNQTYGPFAGVFLKGPIDNSKFNELMNVPGLSTLNNVTILVMGASATGKTYTLFGDDTIKNGLLYQAIESFKPQSIQFSKYYGYIDVSKQNKDKKSKSLVFSEENYAPTKGAITPDNIKSVYDSVIEAGSDKNTSSLLPNRGYVKITLTNTNPENTFTFIELASTDDPYALLLEYLPTYNLPAKSNTNLLTHTHPKDKDFVFKFVKEAVVDLLKNVEDDINEISMTIANVKNLDAIQYHTTLIDCIFNGNIVNCRTKKYRERPEQSIGKFLLPDVLNIPIIVNNNSTPDIEIDESVGSIMRKFLSIPYHKQVSKFIIENIKYMYADALKQVLYNMALHPKMAKFQKMYGVSQDREKTLQKLECPDPKNTKSTSNWCKLDKVIKDFIIKNNLSNFEDKTKLFIGISKGYKPNNAINSDIVTAADSLQVGIADYPEVFEVWSAFLVARKLETDYKDQAQTLSSINTIDDIDKEIFNILYSDKPRDAEKLQALGYYRYVLKVCDKNTNKKFEPQTITHGTQTFYGTRQFAFNSTLYSVRLVDGAQANVKNNLDKFFEERTTFWIDSKNKSQGYFERMVKEAFFINQANSEIVNMFKGETQNSKACQNLDYDALTVENYKPYTCNNRKTKIDTFITPSSGTNILIANISKEQNNKNQRETIQTLKLIS